MEKSAKWYIGILKALKMVGIILLAFVGGFAFTRSLSYSHLSWLLVVFMAISIGAGIILDIKDFIDYCGGIRRNGESSNYE